MKKNKSNAGAVASPAVPTSTSFNVSERHAALLLAKRLRDQAVLVQKLVKIPPVLARECRGL